MAASSHTTSPTSKTTRRSSSSLSSQSSPTVVADVASWYCAAVLLVLILLGSVRESSSSSPSSLSSPAVISEEPFRGTSLLDRHCDEIYVVGEGETLHTISDKCGDPFIVERNPHIHDPDDVFPGLVIKIAPSKRLMK